MNKTFCPECRKVVSYTIKKVSTVQELKGKDYEYIEKQAFCDECNAELWVDTLEEENLKNLYDVYRRESGTLYRSNIMRENLKAINENCEDISISINHNTLAAFEEGDRMIKDPTAQRYSSVEELFEDLVS